MFIVHFKVMFCCDVSKICLLMFVNNQFSIMSSTLEMFIFVPEMCCNLRTKLAVRVRIILTWKQ